MSKRILFLILIYFSISVFKLSAQGGDPFVKKADPNAYVHWFYVRAEQKKDRITKEQVYVIRILSKTPKSGKMIDYEKDLYRCLQGGQQLTIGPFRDYQDALRSLSLYDLAKYTEESMTSELESFRDSSGISEYFFYTLKYRITERTHKYVLERQPARISEPGSLLEFRQALWVGLSTLNLMIGPFTTQEEAEESKSMYRSQEEK